VDSAGTLLSVAGENTLSSSSNIAAESLCGAWGRGGNFANGWTDRQCGAAYCNTLHVKKNSGHSHQSQSTANMGFQDNPTDGVVLIK
jgi:hypothetical protein